MENIFSDMTSISSRAHYEKRACEMNKCETFFLQGACSRLDPFSQRESWPRWKDIHRVHLLGLSMDWRLGGLATQTHPAHVIMNENFF